MQTRSSRLWRTSPRTSDSGSLRGWWWWLEPGSARRVASQISGTKVRYDFIKACYEPSGASWGSVSTLSPLTGLQAAVSMTTCSSTTCRTPRPYSRSAFSITTQIRSSPWPKSCTRGTISPTWLIILCDCSTRRSSCWGCTRRTSTGWKDVCVFISSSFFLAAFLKMLLSSYFIVCVCGKWQEFLLRCWWRLTVHLPRPPAPSAGGTTRERSCEWVNIWICKYFKYQFNCSTQDVSYQGHRSQSVQWRHYKSSYIDKSCYSYWQQCSTVWERVHQSRWQIWTPTYDSRETTSPDSIIKSLDFVSCWVRSNLINFWKHCLWQTLN